MSSYRVTVSPGQLRPGVAPQDVVPAVADAVAELATVESSDVRIDRGRPRIVVRFDLDSDELAEQVAAHAASVADALVDVGGWWLTRRDGGRWKRIA